MQHPKNRRINVSGPYPSGEKPVGGGTQGGVWTMWGDEDYDSTWAESEEEGEGEGDPESAATSPKPQQKPAVPSWNLRTRQETGPRSEKRNYLKYDSAHRWRNWRAAKDLQRYRHGYPDLDDKVKNNDNVNFKFYMNQTPSQPDEWTIKDIIQNWKGKYPHLEKSHSYIQWLFPLREPGMNWHAKELSRQEIELFRNSKDATQRLIKVYEIMLDFYGIKLVNRKTGAVKRAPHWKERFNNLNQRSHNNLRITRILKCLGEMGFEHYQPPLVKFFLTETLVHNQLPNVKDSVLDYFLYTIRSKIERRKLILYAQKHYRPAADFIWGPPKEMEHRFKHIREELWKEEEEPMSEEMSDEDTLAKAGESSSLPSDSDEGHRSKQRRVMKGTPSDSREKSSTCQKDTDETSEYQVETEKPDETIDQERCNAEEKSDGDGISPASENKCNENGEKQIECEEVTVVESIKADAEDLVQDVDVPENGQTKHERMEADVGTQEMEGEATCQMGKELLVHSGKAGLFINETEMPVMEGKVVKKKTEEGLDERAEPERVITEAGSLATEESKTSNISKEEVDEVAKPEVITKETDKSLKEETAISNTEQKNMSTELEGQSKSERNIPHPANDESECTEEMETQEVGLLEAGKDPVGLSMEMEMEASKCAGEEDVEMEDDQQTTSS
ncbi:opioid growth factor receptor-like protein 1 isoform X3 [Chiloscyllium plagiosum]|uniref:opioid growth factor receptor-like protein 1 isoform X3 n=1 Tax=Chiloscyllium plagiosum TaxID=36176 RepID=UPI001CB8662D|nr:opioid growth factor receptor-like protein 1 isoform X3 [Chiloscyllium plagiosum]